MGARPIRCLHGEETASRVLALAPESPLRAHMPPFRSLSQLASALLAPALLASALLTVACSGPGPAGPDGGVPGDGGPDGGGPPPTPVRFEVHAGQDVRPISPFIYGTNMPDLTEWAGTLGLVRLGGNRWTAYNWENNASNAGSDYQYQNDAYLCSGTGCDAPGEAVRRPVAAAHAAGAAALVTVPILDHVAADKLGGGDVSQTANYLLTRFRANRATKGGPLSLAPDTADDFVSQDEFVHWVESTFPGARTDPQRTLFYSLDNEPDLWSDTHVRIHPDAVTYAELVERCTRFAAAIKAQAPAALVFGPVNFGWSGYVNLQNAPDAQGRDFLDFFLQRMRQAEAQAGRRLVDVLDLHWYPEARGDNRRITSVDDGTGAAARLQAPRSLWDPTYVESSWITQCCSDGPIRLIPRMLEKIAAHYPEIRLAFTEWNYGGGAHISGGIATADVLGIFGREGVFAANHWRLHEDEPFVRAAFRMFRNYDGQGGRFGDTSVRATTTDVAATSVYASVDAGNPDRLVLVALNKTAAPLEAALNITHPSTFTRAAVYTLTSAGATPQRGADVQVQAGNSVHHVLPANSVTTLVLQR